MDTKDAETQMLEIYHKHLLRILELAKTCVTKISVREDDDFGFMAMNFLSRQIDHAESVLLLIPRMDTSLIARTMFDGLCQLLWAYQAPVERGRQWRAFAFIHDWRLQISEMAKGKKIDEIQSKKAKQGMAEYGHIFLKKGKDTSNSADPYHQNWRRGVKLLDMAKDVKGEDEYHTMYASASDWEHWGPGGFGYAISRSENQITFSTESKIIGLRALGMACDYLLNVVEVVDAHLSLSKTKAIGELRTSCIAELEARGF